MLIVRRSSFLNCALTFHLSGRATLSDQSRVVTDLTAAQQSAPSVSPEQGQQVRSRVAVVFPILSADDKHSIEASFETYERTPFSSRSTGEAPSAIKEAATSTVRPVGLMSDCHDAQKATCRLEIQHHLHRSADAVDELRQQFDRQRRLFLEKSIEFRARR